MRLSRGTLIGFLAASLAVPATPAVARSTVPDSWRAGVNVTDWSPNGYAQARDTLEAARAAGATSVTLVPTLYVDDVSGSSVAPDPDRTPTDASLRQAASDARELGLSITIKPHVDVLDGTFRGELAPTYPADWFASYRGWLEHYARLAQAVGARTLVIGTELDSLTGYRDDFEQLIASARGWFGGELTYAANWTAIAGVGFWSSLDLIGVDAYVPLGNATSSAAQLRAAWEPFQEQLAALHQQTGKPVIFTELGYQSRHDALGSPFDASGPSNQAVQARAYEAAFAAWSGVPWFRGISWWEWRARPAGASAGDGGFSPRDKNAEEVLRRWSPAVAPAPARASLADRTLLVLGLVLALAMTAAVVLRRRRPKRRHLVNAPDAGVAAAAAVAAERLLARARSTLDSSSVVLCVRDPDDPRRAHVAMGLGVPGDFVGRVLSSDEGLMGHVLMTGNPIAVANYSELPAPVRHPFIDDTLAALSVPVRLDGEVVGALTVSRADQYAPSERHLLSPLADELAPAARSWLATLRARRHGPSLSGSRARRITSSPTSRETTIAT